MDISIEGAMELFHQGVHRLKRLQFNQKEQQAFLEDLFVLVDDGIPPNRAIDMMVQVSRGISKEVAVSIANKISEGQPLAEGMRDWFSVNIVEIIRVGEEGGALAQTMSSGINSLSQSSGIISALVAAITYPVMVIVMACGVIVYLDRTVFTQFKLIKPIEQWPEAGQTLVAVAGIIRNWWWAVIVIGVAFVLIMRRILTSYVGDFRPFLDQFPPFSLYRRLEAARVMETLGLLVENGIVFKSALRVMQYRATPYVATHLLLMEHLLGVGKGNIADVLSTGLIDDKDILRLRVMGEVRGFEQGLVRMGVSGAEEATRTMKLIAKIAGGVLLGLGAMMIMIIVRGIFMTGMAMGS